MCAAAAVLSACTAGGPQGYSGTVQAQSAAVGSTIGGRVTAVRVQDGDRVKAGQVLVELDGSAEEAAYRAALDQARSSEAALADLEAGTREPDLARAQAQAAQAQAAYDSAKHSADRQLAALDDQVRQARANVASARAAANDTAADARRAEALLATGDVSQQSRDAAQTRADQARADLNAAAAAASAAQNQRDSGYVTIPRNEAAAMQSLRAAQASYQSLAIGPRPDAVAQARAAASAARANASNAQARVDQMTVRAPASGVITALDLHRGDILAPNAAAATVDEDGEPFVRVFIPQSELGKWRVGDPVVVVSDASPKTEIPGTIEAVDSRAQFTPQNVQTAEDRADLTFGVKVRIHDKNARVHGGTTATVRLP